MASIEGGSGDSTGRSRLNFISAIGKDPNSWLRRNWHTAVILVLVVMLAFFVRSYFVWGPSVDNGFLVSGGSDSYYHERVIDYVTETGQHLYMDPLLNYPWEMRNPRPPLFDWSVAVTGMVWSSISGDAVSDGTSLALIGATAFWGALTCIPVYLIGRQAFSRKVGLVAAFLFALTPGHIERSVASQADHDAMILFLVVFGFYFLLMSLKTIAGDKWVKNWKEPKSILAGLKGYVGINQVSLIYAALAGVCVSAVAFIWTGYMYVLVIVLVYFLFQIIVNRFRNADSMGVWISVGIMLGLAFVLAGPLYWTMNYWYTWFDVPLLLFLGLMVIGLIFVSTRDLPWTLVMPAFILLLIGALVIISYVSPNLFDAIITGQGYLLKSKLYSTISEAQAPNFSTLAMSFGVVTFWLALVGIGYAAVKIPKNLSAYFVFLVVWTATAVFMSASAGRFLFNAAPAFAVMAGWILVLVIDAVRFQDYPKGLEGVRPWRTPFVWLKKVFKVKYVMAVLFVFMLVLLPNAWAAVDAGIPSEYKKQYDLQVYNAMPVVLRPSDYDSINGSVWYFGAFGFSLPLPKQYWPAAWSWFETQDTNLPVTERPAFLSWWDYGFEAIQAGDHPTVADNFQNGYQFAGNYITCTDEAQAVAMLVIRCIEYEDLSDGSPVAISLAQHGADVAAVRDILTNPANYVPVVLGSPEIYGNFSADLSPMNAKYVAARVQIAEIGEQECASLYHEIRSITESDVGYFAIDSRLFPFTATGYNIFYAPAKLSDHVIDEASNSPVEFYQIYAVVINQYGQQETVLVDEVDPDTMTVIDYTIVYTSRFYETMLYRAFMGYGPYDIGYTEQGLPGISGSLASLPPMQGWNQTHFRMVYRTAYFNPFPEDQVANHTDAWIAISYDEALVLREKIANGEIIGVVDTSAYGLAQAVVFVQYYDGAIIQGQVTTESGLPYPDIWVTVLDEYGIPHDYVKTDANGEYSVIAPFGDVEVIYSIGSLDKRLLMASELDRQSFYVTYDQAMRQTDYILDGDISITSANLKGKVFWDADGDSKFTSGTDAPITGATVLLQNETTGFEAEATTTADGYVISDVPAMNAQVYAIVEGHPTIVAVVKVLPLVDTTVDIPIAPASIGGTVYYADGARATNFVVELVDKTNGTVSSIATDSQGKFAFDDLVYGDYELRSGVTGTSFGPQAFRLSDGEKVIEELTVKDAMRISGQAWISIGVVAANATISLYNDDVHIMVRADRSGHYTVDAPVGTYNLYCAASIDGRDFAALSTVSGGSGSMTYNPLLVPASYILGKAQGTSSIDGITIRFQSRTSGAVLDAVTNESGQFRALVPNDQYFVQNGENGGAYWADVTVTQSGQLVLNLVISVKISGVVWYDANGNSVKDSGEGLEGVPMYVTDTDGRTISQITAIGGSYEFQLVPGKNYVSSIAEAGYASYAKSFMQLTSSVQENVQLKALNRTVTGTTTYLGATMPGMTVTFKATGKGAISLTTETSAGGQFAVALQPGNYEVYVDQDVVPGNNVSKYQYNAALTIEVGKDPSSITIELVKRYLVIGTITPDRGAQATLTISGPDDRQLKTGTSFSLYLQEGDYSFYAFIERLGSRYATLIEQTITSGTTSVELVNQAAYLIQGSVKNDGKAITGNAPVSIEQSTGGTLQLTTTLTGAFTTYLPAGNYTASVDYRTKEVVSTKDRYVRYLGSTTFDLSSIKFLTVAVEKQLDNSTLSGMIRVNGQPVAASLEFVPASTSAIWANFTATASGYIADIAPGNYSIYVKEVSGPAVYMGKVDVRPYTANALDLDLVPGVRYFGTTELSGTPGSALLEFSSENYKNVQSAADGSFEVYLPPDVYTVRATAVGSESGVYVQYKLEYQLNLQSSQGTVVGLAKVAKYGVDVQWDSAEKRTIAAGQNVSYNLRVINNGNVRDTYTLSAVGLTSGWTVSFSQNPVTLDFGTANSQLVTVTINTPANAKVNHPVINIRAQSGASATSDTQALEVGILPQYSVSLTYKEPTATTGSNYVYKFTFKNTGNADDTYNISTSNAAELESWGWMAQMRLTNGQWSDYLAATLSSGSEGSLELRLTPIRENPDGKVTVALYVASQKSPETVSVTQFVPVMPQFNVPSGDLSVTGPSVSTSMPQVPTTTLIILGLVIAMATILIVLSLQKGVFRRGKR